MGCCSSVPHAKRRYRDPADLDEVYVPLREFGNYRTGSAITCPDDINGLPSTHIYDRLATDPDTLLYSAEIDQARACRCLRFWILLYACPPVWVFYLTYGLGKCFSECTCDEMVCWLRKEYSTRTFFRVFPNRIETNYPSIRLFGLMGCGSWAADSVIAHPFDRGGFGFRPIKCGIRAYLCCIWPVYGGSVGRQRCQCNGSLWPRFFECGGWWCDEWCCDMCCCTYRYAGIADADETSFAAGIALQAYFEGRKITKADMDKCIEYWRDNISEMADPVGRKRDVCCEDSCAVPCCSGAWCYENVCNVPRWNYCLDDDALEPTEEWQEVRRQHDELREKQVKVYNEFTGPVRNSTVCRAAGCRRVFGRRGLIFCTEGCCDGPGSKKKEKDDPAPPFRYRDIDDENDASVVLQKVLGNPPRNVAYRRWQWDEENQLELVEPPPSLLEDAGRKTFPVHVHR